MRTFLLTSTAFIGEVEFIFNDSGLLDSFDKSKAELSEKQQLWILKQLPQQLNELQRVLGDSKTAALTEIKESITFEQFWNRYDEKIRSSKKKALQRWNRMCKSQQLKAYKFITRYEQSIPSTVMKKYAETYLNSELWNN